ncbi:MAG: hypothetical protein KAT04_04080 [Methylococcales bacterium]|nr:hypothetical protein [Methylococcales bacterium]
MSVDLESIISGFDYVSAAPIGKNQAYLNKKTGKIVWHTDMGDNFEELPDDLDDEKYIEIPHKSELGGCPRIETVARGSHFESDFSFI